jgi:putative PIN family toxin of toxin-antitoxin system
MRMVFDTDVVVAGVISPTGASRLWLEAILRRAIMPVISVPLALQYEAVLKRPEVLARSRLAAGDVDGLLDGLVKAAALVRINYLWRPSVRDPGDEMVLEAAVNGGAAWLLTFNVRDFADAARHGVRVERPGAAWRELEGTL